jgi:osmotically inducible lipoprotein OsmB
MRWLIMKNLLVLTLSTILLVGSLTACTSSQRKDSGMVIGGVAGGVAGSALTGGSTAGTIAGAVGGGYIGRQVAQ